MSHELIIQHGNTILCPPVADGVGVEFERKGQPGKLTFECIKTDGLEFDEGEPCRFSVGGEPFFYGFVFNRSRSGDNPNKIKVTVYNQLYYLNNKDTYVYQNKTATEVIRMIAEDYGLNIGTLADTKYKIASRVEDNTSLFDIIQNALDETMKATGEMYVLYDQAGKLMLSNVGDMHLGFVVDPDTAGDFDYKTSISDNTYNRIKLVYENSETGARQVYISQDSANINKWGVLQYFEKIDDTANAKAMADALLKLYNAKTRTLKFKDVLGDTRVKAGTLLLVLMDLGDVRLSRYMLVEQVKHNFKDNQHLMELRLRGDDFVT